MSVLVAILGLAVLMIVHEAGHFFAARAFGLRVTKFSIGFGPTFFKIVPENGFYYFTALGDRIKAKLGKHDPEKHGPTVFQAAMIPFFAYVQIAGMNPFEEVDAEDKGSYANSSVWARVVTIVAGPLANYVFASVFFFTSAYFQGVPAPESELLPTQIAIVENMPAAQAGFKTRDQIVSVDGQKVESWDEMAAAISKNGEREIPVVVLRDGKEIPLTVTPKTGSDNKARIGVQRFLLKSTTFGEALKYAALAPPETVQDQLMNFGKLIAGKSEAKLGGPKMMVETMAQAVDLGWGPFVTLLGALSAWLAALNLLPIPALDGGRLMFLSYEATTRKRPNPTVEAQIHAVGFVLLFALMIYVTLANDFGLAGSK